MNNWNLIIPFCLTKLHACHFEVWSFFKKSSLRFSVIDVNFLNQQIKNLFRLAFFLRAIDVILHFISKYF